MIRIQWTTNETIRDEDIGGDTIAMDFREIVIDATTSESLDISATPTEHPIENGQSITDHIQPGLRRVSMDCVVSNLPMSSSIDQSIRLSRMELPSSSIYSVIYPTKLGETRQNQVASLPQKAIVAYVRPAIDRPRDVIAALETLILSGTEVSILGLRLGDLDNYVITSISPSVDVSDCVTFSLSAQEVKTVELAEVNAPSPRVERARHRASQGTQPPATPETSSPAAVPSAQSLARDAMDVGWIEALRRRGASL